MKSVHFVFVCITFFLLQNCAPDLPSSVKEVMDHLPEKVDFNVDVKPILSDKCFACHGPDKNKVSGGLQLHTAETAFAPSSDDLGTYPIVPGSAQKSAVFHRIISNDPNMVMPPPESNLELTEYEKAVLIKWIEEGANYKPHWAFIKPHSWKLPMVQQKEWPKNEIDYFILGKLEQEDLKPSHEAEKALLLRRVSLDLTGLPPTETEIQAFLEDDDPDAYEKQVDRLLDSPHYGEKMATDWMDVARFADTHGYTVDRFRDMSPWRDWVIKSFNENRSYDQFVTWQLAGDLFSNPSKEQMIATGFNRLHQQNMEGGIIDEEFRVEYVADRTAVLGTGFMGMTLSCARCHDHKYDPISQKEHYELYSFFNNVNESGQISWNDDTPVPTMLLPTEKQEEILTFLEKQIAVEEQNLESAVNEVQGKFEKWLTSKSYQSIDGSSLTRGLQAKYKLDGNLKGHAKGLMGVMKRTASAKEFPSFVEGRDKKGLKLDGDAWLDLHPTGVLDRSSAFSIGLWIKIPEELEEGVIFHKCDGAKLYNFKGYHLYLKDNKLEGMLAHTAPDNAIIEVSKQPIPKNEWIHLMMTYDGSNNSTGLKIYLNGKELETEVEIDNLYKNITYNRPFNKEPGLQIGARWRGMGIKGSIVNDIVSYNRVLSPIEILWLYNPKIANNIITKPIETLNGTEKQMLKEYYLEVVEQSIQVSKMALKEARKRFSDSIEHVKEIMVMKEMPKPRQAYVLVSGQYNEFGEMVFPNTPQSILPFPTEYPKNRLGLAQWLFHPDHPLTARVTVNRYWQNYFGNGIVRTSEDFGNQGELPSHPKLLDWLAIYFMENGWNVKALQKKIVMSATYRQQSTPNQQLRDKDPENVLLARGPVFRLTSEMLRDNALLASRLLNPEIGGKSVKPYQPKGLWKTNGGIYQQDTGPQLYRRSLYTFWKRTVPHPTQATFDQPDRSECYVKRQKTNTPLQALALLNDPTFVEASKKIGEQITKANNTKQAIHSAFVKLTGREPSPEELTILIELQQSEFKKMSQNQEKTKGWLNAGAYQVDSSLDSHWLAANTVLASTIMNSDAFITRR